MPRKTEGRWYDSHQTKPIKLVLVKKNLKKQILNDRKRRSRGFFRFPGGGLKKARKLHF